MPNNQNEKFFTHWVAELFQKKGIRQKDIASEITYDTASISLVKNGKRPIPDEVFNRFLEKYELLEDYKAYMQSGFATFSKLNLQLGNDIQVLHRIGALEKELSELRRQMNNVQDVLLRIQGVKPK